MKTLIFDYIKYDLKTFSFNESFCVLVVYFTLKSSYLIPTLWKTFGLALVNFHTKRSPILKPTEAY